MTIIQERLNKQFGVRAHSKLLILLLRRRSNMKFLACLWLLFLALPLRAQSRIFDVTQPPYNADKTGKTDATVSIGRAIGDMIARAPIEGNQRTKGHLTLYFPDGIYQISGPLSFSDLQWAKAQEQKAQGKINNKGNPLDAAEMLKRAALQIHVQGQSREKTIIRLIDNAPGFNDANKPRAVLSFFDGQSSNIAFSNTAEDFSIEVGAANAGAIGLNFHNNNVGCVRRVSLKAAPGSGAIGLQLGHQLAGIGLVKDVVVQGFGVGISNVNNDHVTYSLENIQLQNQREVGILSRKKGLSIRALTSENRVPVVRQDGGAGQVILIDSQLRGGAPDKTAIENSGGWLLARNIQTQGYGAALRDHDEIIKGDIKEHLTGKVYRLWDDAPLTTLNLPIEETPDVPREARENWAIVESSNADDTKAIQAAIDSGKSTVFLSRGSYQISDTIVLRGKVQRFDGDWSRLDANPEMARQSKPLFRFADGAAPVVIFEQLDSAFGHYGKTWYFQNDTTRTVVLRDLFLPYGAAYRNSKNGKLFIEDICSGGATKTYQSLEGWIFKNQSVWARHLNHEGTFPHIVNDGGKLWILAFKMGEEYGPYFITKNNGQTELLGGILNSLSKEKGEGVAIINDNSDCSISLLERSTTRQGAPHPVTIREIRGGETREFKNTDFPKRDAPDLLSPVVPLYRGDSRK